MDQWRIDLLLALTDFQRRILQNAYVSPQTAAERLERISAELSGVATQKPSQPQSEPPVREVFEYWKLKTGHDRATLDTTRSRIIRARLADGLSVDRLKMLIDWVASSDHHRGNNERGKRYDWIENIMHSTAQVERNLLEYCGEKPECSEPLFSGVGDEIERLEREAEKARRDDDVGRYNEIQRQLRELAGD